MKAALTKKHIIGDQSFAFGSSNFIKIIEKGCRFVDKSLLIREIIEDKATIKLILRPSGFGKTTNMDMLYRFFNITANHEKSLASLFHSLAIWHAEDGKYQTLQGHSPVIFITFKDIRSNNYDMAYEQIKYLIADIYNEHDYLLDNDFLQQSDQIYFESIFDCEADEQSLKNSLKKLSEFLFQYHQKKVMILLDEYDTPIQAAWLSDSINDCNNLVSFIQSFFSSALKDNPYLEQAILTGILRITDDGLFSDLNNIMFYDVTSDRYGEYFGFTDEEVAELVGAQQWIHEKEQIKNWYGNYRFGQKIVFNPYSILRYIMEDFEYQTYWTNNANNVLTQKLLTDDLSISVKKMFLNLVRQGKISCVINQKIVLNHSKSIPKRISTQPEFVLNFLLMSGYLSWLSQSVYLSNELLLTFVIVPNREVNTFLKRLIARWDLTTLKEISFKLQLWNKIKHYLKGSAVLVIKILKEVLFGNFFVDKTVNFIRYDRVEKNQSTADSSIVTMARLHTTPQDKTPIKDTKNPLTTNKYNQNLKFFMHMMWFMSLLTVITFITFNLLTFLGVMLAPFSFMTTTTSSLSLVIACNIAALTAVPTVSFLLGSLHELVHHYTLNTPFAEFYSGNNRLDMVYDLTNLGTVIGVAVATLLTIGFIVTTLGFNPSIAGLTFVIHLTGLFGSSLVAGITATIVMSGITIWVCRETSYLTSIILGLVAKNIPAGSKTQDGIRPSLHNRYTQLRNFLLKTHSNATLIGAFIGAIVGSVTFALSFFFFPTLVATNFTFLGPLLTASVLVLSSTFLSALMFALVAEHYQHKKLNVQDHAFNQSTDIYLTKLQSGTRIVDFQDKKNEKEEEQNSEDCVKTETSGKESIRISHNI